MNEHEFKLAVLEMGRTGVHPPELKAEVQRRMGEKGNRCPFCKKKIEPYKGVVHESTGKIVRKSYRCDPCAYDWDINIPMKEYVQGVN